MARVLSHASCPTILDYLRGALPSEARLLCPFHDDHRPTAKVLPGRGRFWCFRCQIAEDRLGVAMRLLFPETHHLRRPGDLAAATLWLRHEGWSTGLATSHVRSSPAAPEELSHELFLVITRFCQLANDRLQRHPQVIRDLHTSRGLRDPVGLGLGLGHWRLFADLKAEFGGEVDDTLFHQAGLLSDPARATPERPVHYRLADRIIIPEWRPNPWGPGRLVAFYQARGRDGSEPKYLNPAIPRQLFGTASLDQPGGLLWIGEGVFDVLPLIEAGQAALASLGVHLGEVGIEQLVRLANGRLVVIAFDNDPPKGDEPLGLGLAQGLALQGRLRSAGARAAIAPIPARHHDLGEWLTAEGAAEVIAAVRLAI